LLDFLKAKDQATFTDINWENNQLYFKIRSELKHTNGLACMVPYLNNGKKILKITVNGVPVSYSVKPIKGRDYAFLTIRPGSTYNLVISYKD
jgi:hypothetical protein